MDVTQKILNQLQKVEQAAIDSQESAALVLEECHKTRMLLSGRHQAAAPNGQFELDKEKRLKTLLKKTG